MNIGTRVLVVLPLTGEPLMEGIIVEATSDGKYAKVESQGWSRFFRDAEWYQASYLQPLGAPGTSNPKGTA